MSGATGSGSGSWFAGLCFVLAISIGLINWIGDGGGLFRLQYPRDPISPSASSTLGFPLTKTDALGHQVSLPAPPRRIASQALATDHLLFPVVPHSRIVAVSTYASRPAYSNIHERVRKLGLPAVVDPESVLALRPDLVMSSHIANPDHLRLVRDSGLPVYAMRTVFATLDEIPAAFELVGELTGERETARRAADGFIAELNSLRKRAMHDSRRERVLGYSSYLTAYGSGSIFEDIVTSLGAINVGSEKGLGPWGNIGPEQIVAWNPDWIVTSAAERPVAEARAAVAADPAVKLTSAGRRNQIVVVHERHFLSMSQHVLELVRAVAVALESGRGPAGGSMEHLP